MDKCDPIDFKRLNRVKEVMKDNFPKLIEYFLNDSEKYISALGDSIEENDKDKIFFNSHTLKSCTKNLGFDRISNRSSEIENICKNSLSLRDDHIEEISNLFDGIKSDYVLIKTELQKL